MSANSTKSAVVLEAFKAIETRDGARFDAVCAPDLELHWPPQLHYGGVIRGALPDDRASTWEATWAPFQSRDAERSMDPRVIAESGDEVVVLWRQRGLARSGDRLDSPVLGLYEVREQRLVRAQMFYFDADRVEEFLKAHDYGRGEQSGTEAASPISQ